jgi:hypothetical protein
MAAEISFEDAAALHGLTKAKLMGACNLYIDKAPKPVRQDNGTRKKYFDPDEMSAFIDWYLGLDHQERADGVTRPPVRSDLEIQQAELVRAQEAIDRHTKRVEKWSAELAKAKADLAKAEEKKAKAQKLIVFFKKQKQKHRK